MSPGESAALTQLCERLGASPTQAAQMAAQLVKRAEQLAERGGTREAALARLLDLLVRGCSGEVPPEFQPSPPPGKATSESV
jgi:hypothetical protein